MSDIPSKVVFGNSCGFVIGIVELSCWSKKTHCFKSLLLELLRM
jgi:hypothetical protein